MMLVFFFVVFAIILIYHVQVFPNPHLNDGLH